jgi:hypothetical protein
MARCGREQDLGLISLLLAFAILVRYPFCPSQDSERGRPMIIEILEDTLRIQPCRLDVLGGNLFPLLVKNVVAYSRTRIST